MTHPIRVLLLLCKSEVLGKQEFHGIFSAIAFDLLLGDDEVLRPSAIIPWSQYQRRMAQMHKNVGIELLLDK